jgi:two-component system, LuxR family, response regulator FixJ
MSVQPVIHVVDDDSALRASLSFLLASAEYDVRTYESAPTLLACSETLAHGCIVTDIRMPGMNGLELTRELKRRGVIWPVIVLTGHAEVSLAVAAMKAGAVDFLEKPFQDEALLSAIAAALAHATSEAMRTEETAAIARRAAALTPRERDVFNAIVAGDSNKEAAQRLGISPRTVEIYRANAMEKMGARTLSDLVRMALRGGLI